VSSISGTKKQISKSKLTFKQYEYEAILLIFLMLRFVFKNLPDLKVYFTAQPIFGLSNTYCIVLGTAVLFGVFIFLSSAFGNLIKHNGPEFEKPVAVIIVIFLSCPASLPFLFDTASLSGSQMLYPFALFVLSVFLINKPFFKLLVPLICAVYFLPATFTSEIFFSVLRKGAILYVPLILLLLFLDMKKQQIVRLIGKKAVNKEIKASSYLFYTGLTVSIGAFFLSLFKFRSFPDSIFSSDQHLDRYFFAGLLISAPALITAFALLHIAAKNKFPAGVISASWLTPILMLVLCVNNYYGLWIPFLVISLFAVVFYGIKQKSQILLNAVQTAEGRMLKNKFVFVMFLLAMASLSNVASTSLSPVFEKLFSELPF
jgi:hypothetical protein